MHFRMSTWLAEGNHAVLREFWPVVPHYLARSWRSCTCQLYERLRAVVETS